MMAKFAQYYLKYNLEHMFSAEYKDQRQQIFGAFFETNGSIDFVWGSAMNIVRFSAFSGF